MRLTVSGPNAHGGMFHVHAAGCADLNREPYRSSRRHGAGFDEIYDEDHDSVRSVVESVYSDHIAQYEGELAYMQANDKPAWGDQPARPYTAEEIAADRVWTEWEAYLGEFKFFPCTARLPHDCPAGQLV